MYVIKQNSVTSKRYRIKHSGPDAVAFDKVLNAFEKVTRSLVPYDTVGLHQSTPRYAFRRQDKSVIGGGGVRTMRVIRGHAVQTLPFGLGRNLTSTHL